MFVVGERKRSVIDEDEAQHGMDWICFPVALLS
jgi:hypothetical protein